MRRDGRIFLGGLLLFSIFLSPMTALNLFFVTAKKKKFSTKTIRPKQPPQVEVNDDDINRKEKGSDGEEKINIEDFFGPFS